LASVPPLLWPHLQLQLLLPPPSLLSQQQGKQLFGMPVLPLLCFTHRIKATALHPVH